MWTQIEVWTGNSGQPITGYCFSTGPRVISLCSKKQEVVALFSCEAEYMAATMVAQECIWLKKLIKDIISEVDYYVEIKRDSESAIKLASKPIFHAKIKHIKVRYHFIREKVLNQEIALRKVCTNNQTAYIFTKALAKLKFEYFRVALGVLDRKHALRRSVKN